MPDTPPRMDREKLASVVDHGQDYFTVSIGDIVLDRFDGREDNSRRGTAEHQATDLMEQVNAAASAWLDREVKKAVDAERERCAELARTFPWKLKVYGKAEIDEATDDTACEICDQIAAAIRFRRSAPGKDKNG